MVKQKFSKAKEPASSKPDIGAIETEIRVISRAMPQNCRVRGGLFYWELEH